MFVLAAVALPIVAGDLLVPGDTQLRILQRVWTLDRTFPRRRTVQVVILYQAKYDRSVRMMEELKVSAGDKQPAMHLIPVDLADSISIGSQIPAETDVVYITPLRAISIAHIIRETRLRHLRSVTAMAEYVNEGVGLGIIVDRDRPTILINLEAAEREGADYSAQLLKLAMLVKGQP